MNKNLAITLLVGVVGLVLGLGGGYMFRNYQLSQTCGQFATRFSGGPNGGNARFTTGGPGGARGFGGAVQGDIVSQDSKSITVKMADGSTKIIILADSTTYSKSDTASKSDLTVGSKVAVFGTANSDGSVTAQNVQLNPMIFVRPSPSPAQ